MSKSRRPSRRPSASAKRKSARRPAAARKKTPRKTAVVDGAVELSPIRDDIKRAIDALRLLPSKDAIKITIERLERCLLEFDAICDPLNPDGCGTTMTFLP